MLDEAIAQIPARHHRNLLVTVDGASHGLVNHIAALNRKPGRRVRYSIGWELGERERTAIARIPAKAWDHVLDSDGNPVSWTRSAWSS